jgi:hypothetical protein
LREGLPSAYALDYRMPPLRGLSADVFGRIVLSVTLRALKDRDVPARPRIPNLVTLLALPRDPHHSRL